MKPSTKNSTGEATPSTRRVRILIEYCKGCGLCVATCEEGVLELSEEVSKDGFRVALVKEATKCKACGRCYTMCPDAAIAIDNGQAERQE